MTRNIIPILFLSLGLLATTPFCQKASNQNLNHRQEFIIHPGDSSSRFFGDLLLTYKVDSLGQNVNCMLFLSTQLVGIHTLVKEDPTYKFKVQLAEAKSKGTLELKLGFYPQVSTLWGNFTYSVVANNESFNFTGDVVGWYIKQ